MPLSELQVRALRALAAARDPESYVAGSTPLNRRSARYSADIDIFHDRADRVAAQADADAEILRATGLEVAWVRRLTTIHTAVVTADGEQTKLEWLADSDFRFFPTIPDPLFGYRLHPIDLAINKMFAAAGRREVRDIYDLALFHERVAPMSALVWAGAEKSPGFTPEGLIEEIRRNLVHPRSAWDELVLSTPIDPASLVGRLRAALDEAAAAIAAMPTTELGLLYLDASGRACAPDPARIQSTVRHAGARRGHWPSNTEISAAMLETLGDG